MTAKKVDFETKLNRLNEIVAKMENEVLPLARKSLVSTKKSRSN